MDRNAPLPTEASGLLAGASPLSDTEARIVDIHLRAARLRAQDSRRRRARIEAFAAQQRTLRRVHEFAFRERLRRLDQRRVAARHR